MVVLSCRPEPRIILIVLAADTPILTLFLGGQR